MRSDILSILCECPKNMLVKIVKKYYLYTHTENSFYGICVSPLLKLPWERMLHALELAKINIFNVSTTKKIGLLSLNIVC